MYVCVCVYVYLCKCVSMCMCLCMFVYVCICMCVSVLLCVCKQVTKYTGKLISPINSRKKCVYTSGLCLNYNVIIID